MKPNLLAARPAPGPGGVRAIVIAALTLVLGAALPSPVAADAQAAEPPARVIVPTSPASLAARGCPTDSLSTPAPSPLDYTTAIEDAVADHDAGRFADARAQFLRAHGLHPNARTLRGLGMVEFELRNYADSVRYLEAALACGVRPLEHELRAEALRLLARARAYVGELRVTVEPRAASIEVDGVLHGEAPDAPLLLTVGEHTLEVHADGYQSQTRTVSITSPTARDVRVVLAKAGLNAPYRVMLTDPALEGHGTGALPPPPPRAEPKTRLARKWWLWTAVGLAVAGGVTTAIVLTRRDRADDGHVATDNEILDTVLMTLGQSQ